MSAPLKMTAADAQALATALKQMTAMTKDTGCSFMDESELVLPSEAGTLRISWDEEDGEYAVQDWSGR